MSGKVSLTKGLIMLGLTIIFTMAGKQELYCQENENENAGLPSYYSNSFHFDAGEADNAGPAELNLVPEFLPSSLFLYNRLGSFGLLDSKLQASVKTGQYAFMTSYGFLNWDGYRAHTKEYWNDARMALRTTPTANTSLVILGSYVNGLVKLPGALTKSEFGLDPFMADQRAIDRDEKCIAGKGRLDLAYQAKFGKALNNGIGITGFGGISLFQSATREYRIINGYGLGADAWYSNIARFGNRTNILKAGAEISFKPRRIEFYDNLGGTRGDLVEQITNEKTTSTGFYLSDRFEILPEKLFILLSGRYDDVIYKVAEQTVPSRSDRRPFNAITPNVSVDYNALPWFMLFASYRLGFETPADKELESPDPFFLFNPVLKAQTSGNIEAGIQVMVDKEKAEKAFRKFRFRATFYRNFIGNEIVPYEVYGDVFYRNAEKTNHLGVGLESTLVLFKELSFDVSWIWSRFVYGSYSTISMETDSKGNLVQVPRDFSGNTEPAVPEHNLKMSLTYQYPVSKKIRLVANVNYSGVSAMWVDDANSDKTKAYHLLNSFMEWEFIFGHFTIGASAGYNNIFNAVYSAYINTNSANSRFYAAGAPGNWAGMLNLGYTF